MTGDHPKFMLYYDRFNPNYPYVIYEHSAFGYGLIGEKKYQSFNTLEEAIFCLANLSDKKVPIAFTMEVADTSFDLSRD